MSDYISREAAMDAVRRLRIGLRHEGFYKEDLICVEILTRLEAIPAADVAEAYEAEVKKSRWISVTERLPEDGSDILAVHSYCGEVRIVPANYDRGVWYDCVYNRVAEHITHWMPVPKPPKEV